MVRAGLEPHDLGLHAMVCRRCLGFKSAFLGFKVMLKMWPSSIKWWKLVLMIRVFNYYYYVWYFCYCGIFFCSCCIPFLSYIISSLHFSLKQIVVCIDPGILTSGQLPDDNILLQKLESLGASHKIQSQLIPDVITWQRACVQHDVQGETLQVQLHGGNR